MKKKWIEKLFQKIREYLWIFLGGNPLVFLHLFKYKVAKEYLFCFHCILLFKQMHTAAHLP